MIRLQEAGNSLAPENQGDAADWRADVAARGGGGGCDWELFEWLGITEYIDLIAADDWGAPAAAPGGAGARQRALGQGDAANWRAAVAARGSTGGGGWSLRPPLPPGAPPGRAGGPCAPPPAAPPPDRGANAGRRALGQGDAADRRSAVAARRGAG